MANMFDGPVGWVAARLMARMNAGAEAEAVDLLAPKAGDRVLVIGFGPGVGLQDLARRRPDIHILGIDPSAQMMRAARSRNRQAIEEGRIELVQAGLEELQMPAASFDAVLAVHSLQFCLPLSNSAGMLAHLLRPGGKLITITHDWALERRSGSVSAFLEEARPAFSAAGFVEIEAGSAKAEKGRAVLFRAERGQLA